MSRIKGLSARHAAAHTLKLFPAEAATPAVLQVVRAVLPVGGIAPITMAR